jgi:DNA-binding MltR family transcriptional regulator
MLDDKLKEILESFLVDSKVSRKLLTSHNAPLREFASRIDAAYALGFLDDAEHRELHVIRDIRNDFAHDWRTLAFETQSVRDRVRNLHIRGMFGFPTGAEPPRQHFNYSVIAILITLMYRNRYAASERRLIGKWNEPVAASEAPKNPGE